MHFNKYIFFELMYLYVKILTVHTLGTSEIWMMYKATITSCKQECHLVTKPLLSHFIAL